MRLTEESLEQLFRQAAPHPLLESIPPVLRPWLLPVRWDRDRLWAVAHDPTTVAVADLRWVYELPFWRGNDGSWFRVTPQEFIERPDEHPEHLARVTAADLSYPIHVIHRRNRLFVLDGVHRLVRADLAGHQCVRAILLSIDDLRRVVLATG